MIFMEVVNDILGYENVKIVQNTDFFSFSLDSVVLGNYTNIRKNDKKIVDLCTGNAVVPIILFLRSNKNIVGIEIQEKIYNLANKSILLNGFEDSINIINGDIKNIKENDFYDLVTCNPPFFKITDKNFHNLSLEKAIARHEIMIKLDEIIKIAYKILKTGGNFSIVYRPDRLIELLMLMKNNNIEPKSIKFIYDKIDKEAISVLVQGQKYGNTSLRVEKPLVIHNIDNTYTEEYKLLIEEVKK